jgi:AcrR family transcriptional regulator
MSPRRANPLGVEQRPSQRSRLVTSMIELSAQSGYQEVSVAQVSSHAGVSSSTFYEQFKDKEHCLLAAYHAAAAHLLGELQSLGRDSRSWQDAVAGALGSVLEALQENPAAARVVLLETRGAGPVLQAERERALSSFEAQVERFLDTLASGEKTLDIPAAALLSGIRAVIVRCLRAHTEDRLTSLEGELIAWMSSYAVSVDSGRWSSSPSSLAPARRERTSPSTGGTPTPIPRGRHSLPPSVVMRSQRLRLINGTAEVMAAKGYAATTVADIVSAAGVSRDVFYAQFADKQHVFLEAQQMGSQDIQDACAASYFSARQWPERVWRCLGTLVEVIAQNQPLAHLRLVECYSAGPAAIHRAEDITRSFAIFLEEGYGYRARGQRLPRLCSQAITGAIFEIIQRHVAAEDFVGLRRSLPTLSYIAIAPFIGPARAAEQLETLKRH